ncbi:unnamed protein product [Linum perenne]
MESWPQGKTLYSGDILGTTVFKYEPDLHNVIVTDKYGYDECTFTQNSTCYHSGDDHLRLNYGNNYFISSGPYDCASGMRMAIFAFSPKFFNI